MHSRPGEGAAFRVYMPQIRGAAEPEPQRPPAESQRSGAGTVLVVEDRDEVRTLTRVMLEELGYRTLAAASGAEALEIAGRHADPIPLLLTDVVMPGMNGRELADRLRQIYPSMKTIFMSGYTDRILANAGALDPSTAYLQKPFTLTNLAKILRRAEGDAVE